MLRLPEVIPIILGYTQNKRNYVNPQWDHNLKQERESFQQQS